VPDERMPPDRAVRLLRAKAGELETRVRDEFEQPSTVSAMQMALLAADIALVASLLADYIEHSCR
jgi:hypothetical protein